MKSISGPITNAGGEETFHVWRYGAATEGRKASWAAVTCRLDVACVAPATRRRSRESQEENRGAAPHANRERIQARNNHVTGRRVATPSQPGCRSGDTDTRECRRSATGKEVRTGAD